MENLLLVPQHYYVLNQCAQAQLALAEESRMAFVGCRETPLEPVKRAQQPRRSSCLQGTVHTRIFTTTNDSILGFVGLAAGPIEIVTGYAHQGVLFIIRTDCENSSHRWAVVTSIIL